jgi:hypothetical protein
MVAAADLVLEVLGLGPAQLPVLHGRLQFGAGVTSADLTQDGLEAGRVPGGAQAFGFLGGHAARRHHAIELPEDALLLFARPGTVRFVGHDRTLS